MAEKAKITGTLSGSNNAKTFTITNIDTKGKSIDYISTQSDTTLQTVEGGYSGFGSDITVLNASTLSKDAIFNLGGTTLTSVVAGKGADTITAASGMSGLKLTTGAGKDIVIAESGTTLTLTDFDTTKDVLRLGTNLTTDIAVATSSGKDLTVTLGTTGKQATLTVKNALGKKLTIQNSTGGYLYEDTTEYGDGNLKTITDSSAGSIVSSASQYIDASGRKKAIEIYASTETGKAPTTQVIIGGAGVDSIHATAGQNASVTSGKGADYIYIDSSTSAYTVTIGDYTVGDAKGADKIVFGAGLNVDTVHSGYQTDGNLKGHIAIIGTGTTAGTVTVDLGTSIVWDQVKPVEAKAQVIALDSKGTVSAAYSNPAELVITDKKVKYDAKKAEGAIDLANDIATVKAANKATFAIGTADKEFDTATTTILNLSNISGPELIKGAANINITASKGKDTIYGGGSATLDGFSGNDMIIAGAGDTGTGGAGNDTLRGAGAGAGAVLTGGAGNDVFALTAEGANNAVITDYYSGRFDAGDTKDSNKAAKKDFGSDKIVAVYDKYNAAAGLGRVQYTGASFGQNAADNTASDLTINVSGQFWVAAATVAASDAYNNGQYVHDTYTQGTSALKYFQDTTANATDASSGTQVYQAGHFEWGTIRNASYKIENALGKAVTFVEQGTTYQQTVSADTSFTGLTANFHAALAPDATLIAAADATKNLKLVGGSKTTVLTGGKKNDTLCGADQATTLTGGTGNDVYMGEGYIADYSTSGTNGKDKIVFDQGTGDADPEGSAFANFDFGTDATLLKVGAIYDNSDDLTGHRMIIKLGTGDITFNNIYNTETQAKLKSGATSTTAWKVTEKKVTDAMIRGFGTASSVVAFGKGSTHAFTYTNIDSGVAIIDASKTGKNTYIENNAAHVHSIVGSAKNDTILAGSFGTNDLTDGTEKYYGGGAYISDVTVTNSQVTVSTGKGNDIIYANGAAYITDFTASKAKLKSGAITGITGDALYFSGADASDVSVASTKLGEKDDTTGRKEQGSGVISFTFDGDDVKFGDGLTLKGMKGKQAYIYTGADAAGKDYDDPLATANLAAGNMATLSNLAEFTASGNDYKNGKKTITGDLGKNETSNVKESDVYIIDATAVSAANIEMGKYVTQVTAGKGIDTIYAGKSLNEGLISSGNATIERASITSGAGADFIVFDADSISSSAHYYLTDYSADKLVLKGLSISGANIVEHTGETATVKSGKGSSAATIYTSDVTLTLTNGKTDGDAVTATVHLVDQSSITGYKVTQADDAAKNASYFALTYGASDVTVGAADGATINLTGAGLGGTADGRLGVEVASNRSKAVTFDGVDGIFGKTLTITMGSSKAGGTFIGGTDTKTVTFTGGNKADAYYGNGNTDVVDLGSGNDTIFGGGKATIKLGSGKDVAIVNASDGYTISDMSADNKILLNTVEDTLNKVVEAKIDASKNLILKFGNDKYGEATGSSDATVTFTSGAGVAINIAQLGTNARKAYTAGAAISGLTYYYSGTAVEAGSAVNSIVGGNSNDTINAFTDASTLTGGKGNDTFVYNFTDTTITDFNTGKDVLDLTGSAVFKDQQWADYGAGYKFDASTNEVILYGTGKGDDIGTIILKNSDSNNNLFKNGVTTNIRYKAKDDQSSAGIKLSDNVNITLAAAAEIKSTDYMGYAKTFDGSKSTKDVTNTTFSSELTSYIGSKGKDAITFTNATAVDLTYTGGADVYNAADKVKLALKSGWSISGATADSTNRKQVKLDIWESRTKTETIELHTVNDVFTFSTGDYTQVDSSAKKKSDITGVEGDSGTTVYQYSASLLVSGADNSGISNVTYGFTTTAGYYANANDAKNKSNEIVKATTPSTGSYEEQFDAAYSPITAPETLYGSSEFDAITTPTTSIDINSLDFSTEDVGGFKAGDLTFDTSLVGKKTQQDK